MAINLFSTAKTVAPPPKAKLKAAKELVELKGLELFACYDTITKWLKTHMETTRTEVIALAKPMFVNEGARLMAKPDSFDAKEGIAVGNIQCRKRGANSALTDLERETLTGHGIPVEEVRDVVDTFVFNPELSARIKADPALGERISKALGNVKGIGLNPIQTQVSTVKHVVSDETVTAMWRKSKEVIEEVFTIVMTPAIRAKVTGEDATRIAFEKVSEFILITGEEAEE